MDVEIAQSIEQNLVPWPEAWEDSHASEYLRTDTYQRILPQYKEAVWKYAVGINLLVDKSDHVEIHCIGMEASETICLHSTAWCRRVGLPGPVPFRRHRQFHFRS